MNFTKGRTRYTKEQEKVLLGLITDYTRKGLGAEQICSELNGRPEGKTANGQAWNVKNLYQFTYARQGKVFRRMRKPAEAVVQQDVYVDKSKTALNFVLNVVTDPAITDRKKVNVIAAYLS